jgi:hypothetical protein
VQELIKQLAGAKTLKESDEIVKKIKEAEKGPS